MAKVNPTKLEKLTHCKESEQRLKNFTQSPLLETVAFGRSPLPDLERYDPFSGEVNSSTVMRPTGHSDKKRRVGDPLRRASLAFDDVYFEVCLTIGVNRAGTQWL
jgi:hypothetical protein